MMKEPRIPRSADFPYYTLRRYYVDQFHFQYVPELPAGSLVLDLGGTKRDKRGRFNVDEYGLKVVYANVSTTKGVDVQADGAHLPFKADSFDAVICSEVLGVVPDPRPVLEEMRRVVRADGRLLLCVPFLNPVTGDPCDYGRYTPLYWTENFARIGLAVVHLDQHGTYWSVLGDMLRDLALQLSGGGFTARPLMRHLIVMAGRLAPRLALMADSGAITGKKPFYLNYATGFGIVATKCLNLDGTK